VGVPPEGQYNHCCFVNVTPQEPSTELQPTVIASAKIPPESDEQVSLVCIVVLQVFVPFVCELLFSRYGVSWTQAKEQSARKQRQSQRNCRCQIVVEPNSMT